MAEKKQRNERGEDDATDFSFDPGSQGELEGE